MKKIKSNFRYIYYFIMFITEAWLLFTDQNPTKMITVAIIFFMMDLIWHYREFDYFRFTTAGVELKKGIDEAKELLEKMNKMQKDSLVLYAKQLQITGGRYTDVNNIYMKILDIIDPLPNISKSDDEIIKIKELVLRMYLIQLNGMERELKATITGKNDFSNPNDNKSADKVLTPEQLKKMIEEKGSKNDAQVELYTMLDQYSKVFNDKKKLCKEIIM